MPVKVILRLAYRLLANDKSKFTVLPLGITLPFWSVGPSLAETIFDAGLRKATLQQYRASYDQTVANYRQTVLTALQEVEDNLSSLRICGRAAATRSFRCA
jgi:outer membrane protein TolC